MRYREFIGMMRKQAADTNEAVNPNGFSIPEYLEMKVNNTWLKSNRDLLRGLVRAREATPKAWSPSRQLPEIRAFQANNYIDSIYKKMFGRNAYEGSAFNDPGSSDIKAGAIPAGMSFREYLKRLLITSGQNNANYGPGVKGQYWSPDNQEEYNKLRQYPMYKKLKEDKDLGFSDYEDNMVRNDRGGNNTAIG